VSVLETVDTWIAGHQALVVAVGLPVLTAIASGIVAFITTKASLRSQEKDRALQRQVRLFDDKKATIEQLRSAVRRYQSTTFMLGVDLHAGLSSGIAGQIPKARVKELLEQSISIMIEIILLVDPNDPDAKGLDAALHLQIMDFSDGDERLKAEEIEQKFFPICRRIVERMEADANRVLAP
jgi:hypothetical protein